MSLLGSLLERSISLISPKWELERNKSRLKLELIKDIANKTLKRSYDANTQGRRGDGWRTSSSSADTEISAAATNIRNRMRELCRNDSYAIKAVRSLKGNVVGSGIRAKPILTGKDSKKLSASLSTSWKDWSDSTDCDFEGLLNFYGLQKLITSCLAESGEVLILKRKYVNNSGIPVQLQVLEPDFLDSSRNYNSIDGGGKIKHGIEYNSSGKRVAYWLFKDHPGDLIGSMGSYRIPASDVIHAFLVERPGQTRGIPLAVSAMLKIRDFNDYEDAELMKQKIAACWAVFITDESDMSTQTQTDTFERVEPGMIQKLGPGENVTFGTPPQNANHSEYSKSVLRGIASSFGHSYETLSNDLSNTSFSSGRMGWIESSRWYSEIQQDVIISMFCRQAWKWFINGAFIAGKISTEKIDCSWSVPRREMIDPAKETKAQIEAIRGGVKSWSDVALENGFDPDELIDRISIDTTKQDDLGLELETVPKWDAGKKGSTWEPSGSSDKTTQK